MIDSAEKSDGLFFKMIDYIPKFGNFLFFLVYHWFSWLYFFYIDLVFFRSILKGKTNEKTQKNTSNEKVAEWEQEFFFKRG